MGADPGQLRQDIEYTRERMSADVDALTEKVSPRRAVGRRVERTRGAMSRMKEQVMGTASAGAANTGRGVSSAVSGVGDAATSAGEAATSAAGSVGDAAGSAVDTARRQTEGNPLAAGLVAFGLGWLVSSLIPVSGKEQQAAAAVGQTAREKAQPAVRQAASELKENLREPAQQAVESVKSTASDAAGTVQDKAKSSAEGVTQNR